MKTNFLKISMAAQPLKTLAKKEIKISEAVAIARIIKSIDEELKIFDEQRKSIFESLGSLNESETEYVFEKDVISIVNEKLDELLKIEVDIELNKITILSEIEACADDVIRLEDFIDFE